MRGFARSRFTAGLVALVVCLALAAPAPAAFSVRVKVNNNVDVDVTSFLASSGTNTYNVGGTGKYLLLNLSTGAVIGTADTFGNSVLGVKISLLDDAPGGQVARLFNTTNEVRNGGGGAPLSVTITASENSYTSPTGQVRLIGSFNASGVIGNSTASFTSVAFQGTTTLASVNGTGSTPFNVTGTYGLRNVTTITGVGANRSVTTEGQTSVVPVPAGVVLACTGIASLLGLGGLRRRKAAPAPV